MRFIYVCDVWSFLNDGIRKKILAQCRVFKKSGHIVDLIIIHPHSNYTVINYDDVNMYLLKTLNKQNKRGNFKIYNLIKFLLFLRYIKKIRKILNNYDIIYVRNSLWFMFLNLFKKSKNFKKKNIYVLEQPTKWSSVKRELSGSIVRSIIYKITEKFRLNSYLKNFDIIVAIGEPSFKLKNEIVISNGIDLQNIPKRKLKNKGHSLNIIGVANISFWHGYDRVIEGLAEYYKDNHDIEVYFHVVGDGPEINNLKKLTEKLNLKKYVIFHGTKIGKELDELFNIAHLAISSLGLHRIDMDKGSNPLKNREYFARGVPFIVSKKDPDFPESCPYLFIIPSGDSPVNIKDIISFYKKFEKNYPKYAKKMRKYAEKNLCWETKLKKLLNQIRLKTGGDEHDKLRKNFEGN